MGLKELLEKRAELIGRQRKLIDVAKIENRTLNNEEAQEFDGIEEQIKSLDSQIEAIQKQAERERIIAEREKDLDKPANKFYRPDFVPGDYSQNNKKKDDGGFESLGEFIHCVRFGDPKGRLDKLPRGQGQGGGIEVPDAFKAQIMPWRFKAEWRMDEGASGGFAVPAQFLPDMLMIQPEAAIVRPRATVIPAGDPPDSMITLPAFDQGANGIFGGVEVYWVGEGVEKPETGGALKEVSLQPYEVAAHTVITDKLLRNWQAASTFISTLLRGAVVAGEDMSFLRGNGVAKPIGILNGAGVLIVNRTIANDIQYVDIVNMLAKLLPESVSRAVWIANQGILPKITTLKDGAGNYIFIQGDATRGIPATLAGIPIMFTGKTPTLGSKGDLMLVDFTYYLIKDGSGPFIAASEHVYFKQNKTVIKVFWNVDGKGWVSEPLTLDDGVTQVSPYVVLDVPAA